MASEAIGVEVIVKMIRGESYPAEVIDAPLAHPRARLVQDLSTRELLSKHCYSSVVLLDSCPMRSCTTSCLSSLIWDQATSREMMFTALLLWRR